jgi:hypothetical protein
VATSQRTYVAGDQFALKYTVLAGAAPGNFDLMITFLSRASGNIYYYYDDVTDSNSRWLHSSMRAASTGVPRSGEYSIPSSATVAFDITDDVPSGEYHIKVYFSRIGTNQPVGGVAETDFSVATSTEAGTCFVATAAFGSSLRPQVRTLRLFRDTFLLPRSAGRAFVDWYYGWSPSAAAWLREHAFARKLVRAALWIPIGFAWLSLRTHITFALLASMALFFLLITGLRRGPAWCRGLFLFVLVIGIVLV